ncbi:MAG: M56 family metallopeptidase [Cyclobacteriaceae bacterium]
MVNNTLFAAIAQTLMHSLWQGAIFLLLLLVLIYIFRNQPGLRYWLSLASLLLFALFNLITFLILWQPEKVSITNDVFIGITHLNANFEFTEQSYSDQFISYLIYAWVAGVLVFSLYRLIGLIYLQRLNYLAPGIGSKSTMNRILDHWRKKLRIAREINLKTSKATQSPFTFGIFKPVIMLPVAMLDWISTDQLEAIIVHEMIHIKRYDYLFNFFISLVEIIYFFNPAVWILKKIIVREREYSCDFLTNSVLNQPLNYCKTLLQLQSHSMQSISVISFSHQKNILMFQHRTKTIPPFPRK